MRQSMREAIRQGEHGWWYEGRRSAIRAVCARTQCNPRGTCLDYGAGFGAMAPVFAGCNILDAFEIHPASAQYLTTTGLYRTVSSQDSHLVTSREVYDVVGIFDVLEHIEDDVTFLNQIHAALARDGLLIGTVPAHPFLFGKHDEQNMHFRRYTKQELLSKIVAAGFNVRTVSYWNMFLFPCFVVFRALGLTPKNSLHPHPILQTVLRTIMAFEAFLMRYVSLPMGLSITFVATKLAR